MTDLASSTEQDTTVVDFTKRLDPAGRARIEQAMASRAGADTDSGRRSVTVGTIVEPTAPYDQAQDDDGGTYVDGPVPWRHQPWRPVLPQAFASREHLKAAVVDTRDTALNLAGYHAIRLPKYSWRVAAVTALGSWAVARNAWHFAMAAEWDDPIDQARRNRVGDQVAELRAERTAVRKARRKELARTAGAAVGGYVGLTLFAAHLFGLVALSASGLLALGALYALGRVEHRRRNPDTGLQILDTYQAPIGSGPINDLRIIEALTTAGLLKDGVDALPVGTAAYYPDGSAIHVYDLTGGLTADKVQAKKKEIAGALRLPADQVDISRGEHESQVSIWTAKKNPFKEGRPSPMFGQGGRIEATDMWNTGVPVGFDHRGDVVHLRLRHVMALLGGMSQTGKGMILRNIIPALALDARVNIRLVSGRKAAELASFAPACATFFGNREERLLALLEAFKAEADRRDDYLEEHGIRRVTEKMLSMFPLEILIIDEAQLYTHNDDIVRLLELISGYAASLNMGVLLVTQDPDAKTIPPKFKKNTKTRVATKTASAIQTNAILNDGATGNGMLAHHIPVSIPGLSIVDADGAEGVLCRSFFIEDREYDGVLPLIEAAVELRRRAGRLPGQFEDTIEDALAAKFGTSSCAGGPKGMGRPGAVVRGILADLLAVFAEAGDPDRLTTAELLVALARMRLDVWSPAALGLGAGFDPADYARAGGAQLAKLISDALDGTPRKLSSRQWKDAGRNVSGFHLADLRTAAALS